MKLLKRLGLQKKMKEKPYPYEDILHLWEDDFLMIELLPNENLDFLLKETKRISEFGQEHLDGSGFSDITTIDEKPFKTIEKLIHISEIETVIAKTGLPRISIFHMQGVGILEGASAPIGFGSSKFAIMCNMQNNVLKDIWITGRTSNEIDKLKLINALQLLGQTYNFIGVNWFQCEYYNLLDKYSIDEFVTNL